MFVFEFSHTEIEEYTHCEKVRGTDAYYNWKGEHDHINELSRVCWIPKAPVQPEMLGKYLNTQVNCFAFDRYKSIVSVDFVVILNINLGYKHWNGV